MLFFAEDDVNCDGDSSHLELDFGRRGECIEAIPGDAANGQDALRLQVSACTEASATLALPCSEGCGSCIVESEGFIDGCVLVDAGDVKFRYMLHSLSCPDEAPLAEGNEAVPQAVEETSQALSGYELGVAGYFNVPEELVTSVLLVDAANPPTESLDGCAQLCSLDNSCMGFTFDADTFRCWPFNAGSLVYPLLDSGDANIFTYKKALEGGEEAAAPQGAAAQVDCESEAADDCFRRCITCMDCEGDLCADADGSPCSACEDCAAFVPCFFQAQEQLDEVAEGQAAERPTTTLPEVDSFPQVYFNPCADPAAYDPSRAATEASCRNHEEIRDEARCLGLRGEWLAETAECVIGENRTACALAGGVMVATTCADIGNMFGESLKPETCDEDFDIGLTGRQLLFRAGASCCPGSGPAANVCGPMINPCRDPAQFTGDLALQYWCSGASATLTEQACRGPGNFWDVEAGACFVETEEACELHGLEWVPRTCSDAMSFLEFDACSVGEEQCRSEPRVMSGSTLEQAISYYAGFCCGGGEVTTLCTEPGSVACDGEGQPVPAQPTVVRALGQEADVPTHPGWPDGSQTAQAVGCQTQCRGMTCDQWVEQGYTCEELQKFDCDCSGCLLCPEELQAPPAYPVGPPSPGFPPVEVDCQSQTAQDCHARCGQCWTCDGGDCGNDATGRPCVEDCFVALSECLPYAVCDGDSVPDCPIGFAAREGICYPCEPGTHQPEFGQTECHDCPPGQFASQAGSSECYACPRGKFADGVGSVECSPCPAGTFQDEFGQSQCQQCAPGSYSDMAGLSACLDCPGGYTSAPGSTGVHMCVPKSTLQVDPCECMDLWEWEGQTYASCAETPEYPGLSWCYAKGAELCERAIRSEAGFGLFWVECEAAESASSARVLQGQCDDTPGWLDEFGRTCGYWEGRDCTKAVEDYGYSLQGEGDVLQQCVSTCGFCLEAPECTANEDCYSTECNRPGWLNLGCNFGQCYTGIEDPACEGAENGFQLGEIDGRPSWCWEGRIDTRCPAKAYLAAGTVVLNYYAPEDSSCSQLWSFMVYNFTSIGDCVPNPQVPDDWQWPTNDRYTQLESCEDGYIRLKTLCDSTCSNCQSDTISYDVGGCHASYSQDMMSTSILHARCPATKSTTCVTIPLATAQRLKAISCARWNDPNERWNQLPAQAR